MTPIDWRAEFGTILDTVSKDSPAVLLHELFTWCRINWKHIDEPQILKETICAKLDITVSKFNIFLTNPSAIYGLETIDRYLKKGWLKSYLEYTAGHEAPEEFHLWVGLTMLSTAVARKCYFDNSYYKLYPNLYVILVAPPGVGKKTVSISIGTELLRVACPDTIIVAEKGTPEKIVNLLANPHGIRKASGGMKLVHESKGLILAPELTTFMGREQYNEGLTILLTRLFDCPEIFTNSTISRATETLRDVYVTMLGATTPSEIGKAIPPSACGGGLLSRLNLIVRETTPRSVPFALPINTLLREWLITELSTIHRESVGRFTVTDDGREWYIRYYEKWKTKMEDGALAGGERQPDQVFKIGMLLAISERSGLILNSDTLSRALQIIEATSSGMEFAVKAISNTAAGDQCENVVTAIRKQGGVMQHTALLKSLWRKMNAKEIQQAIDTLVGAGVVIASKTRPVWYRLARLEEF